MAHLNNIFVFVMIPEHKNYGILDCDAFTMWDKKIFKRENPIECMS